MRASGPICFVISFWISAIAAAQSPEDEIRSENFQESIQTIKTDVRESDQRLDLNTVSVAELMAIHGMTLKFARAIIEHRNSVSHIRSFDELSSLDGSTSDLVAAVKQTTTLDHEPALRAEVTTYSTMSPEKAALYESSYGESGVGNFQKLSIKSENVEAYAVTDKDAGETNCFDFVSASLCARNVLAFSTVVVGDYTLSLGNGILFSRSGIGSKSSEAVVPLFDRETFAIRPHYSRSETGFLRGAAFAVPIGKIDLAAFGSERNLGAYFDTSGDVTSLNTTGVQSYSTANKSLSESIAGCAANYHSELTRFGVAAVYRYYDREFHEYYLRKTVEAETYLRTRYNEAVFAGEVVSGRTTSFTANVGIDYQDARFAFGLRNLGSGSLPDYSGAVAESYPLSPEKGVYVGADLRPLNRLKLGFYYDRFQVSSIEGKPDRNGEEIMAESYFSFSRELLPSGRSAVLYARYRFKSKDDFYVPVVDYPVSLTTMGDSKQSVRLEFIENFSRQFSSKLRYEKVFLSSGETGEVIHVASDLRTTLFRFYAGAYAFRTGSYSSGIYLSEKDLPGVSQFVVLYGDGARIVVLADYLIGRSLSCGLKVSREYYSSKREIDIGKQSGYFESLTDIGVELNYAVD